MKLLSMPAKCEIFIFYGYKVMTNVRVFVTFQQDILDAPAQFRVHKKRK